MIRAARPTDLAAMAALESREPMGTQWTLSQLTQELSNPRAVFLVAELEQRPVGHLLAWQTLDELELLTIAVQRTHRNRGLGRALLNSLCSTKGASVVFLEIRASNAPARALYHSAGFKQVGRRTSYYRDGADALLMRKALP